MELKQKFTDRTSNLTNMTVIVRKIIWGEQIAELNVLVGQAEFFRLPCKICFMLNKTVFVTLARDDEALV